MMQRGHLFPLIAFMAIYTLEQSPVAHFFFQSTKSAPFWLIVRLYVGYEWIMGSMEKLANPAWFGTGAGSALQGFLQGAFAKAGGAHPDVQTWYVSFLQGFVMPHLTLFSNMVAVGELLVGIALVLGVVTGVAAFFGAFMNLNFLLAGTVSVNPQLIVLEFLLVFAWRVAGYWGGDRYALPFLHRICPFGGWR